MTPHPESLDGKPPPKRYRWWRFIEHSLPIIVIYLMVATLVELPDRSERHRDGADRPCRNFVEAIPRRHAARPAPAQGRGHARPAAVGQAVPLRPAAADHDRHLQRHLQGRRESDRDDQHPVPAEARRRAATASDDRPGLHHADAEPEIGNRAREIFAEYTAEEIYSTKRQEIQKKIRTHTEAMLGQSMMQRTEEESEYGEHYRVSLRRDAQSSTTRWCSAWSCRRP